MVHYPIITTTKVPQLQIFSSVVMGFKLCLFKDPDELKLIPELLSAREHIPPALFLFYTYVMDVCCNGYHSSAMKVFQFCLISGTPRENMTFHRHALKKKYIIKKNSVTPQQFHNEKPFKNHFLLFFVLQEADPFLWNTKHS